MKKLSIMMAALALVATTGCDPYSDSPGGDPQILAVNAAGRNVDPVAGVAAQDGSNWSVTGVPSTNGVLVVTTNKLLDGATIQLAPQDPTDSTSTGDCRPAGFDENTGLGSWLKITKDLGDGSGAAAETIGSKTDATTDPYQWYTCYYPGSATSLYGASVEIYRAHQSQAPGLTTTTRPLSVGRFESGAKYVFSGDIKDDAGKTLPINVTLLTQLAAPTDVVATPDSATNVTVTWTVSDSANTTGYKVLRSESADGPFVEVTSVDAATTSFTDVGLDVLGKTYYYVVAAENAFGADSEGSSDVAATKPVPTGLAVDGVTANSATLVWDEAPNATTYTVYRSTSADGPFTAIATGLTAGTYTDTTVKASSSYYYTVSSTNLAGESEQSDPVSATTPAATP